MLYKNLPKTVGLRRLTLHKSRTLHSAEVTYLLLVECTHFMDHIGEAANLLPILRDISNFVACRAKELIGTQLKLNVFQYSRSRIYDPRFRIANVAQSRD